MGQILVRNLDDGVIRRLKQRASRENLSLEETVRQILALAAQPDKPSPEELIAELNRIASMSPPITEPPFSEDLIREDRDSR
jgi:plasmid stability protein